MSANLKTVAAVLVCFAATGLLWLWAAGRFANVQQHQNDALQRILCYLERDTLRSRTVSDRVKVQSLHKLDQIDRIGGLAPCTNLPKLAH